MNVSRRTLVKGVVAGTVLTAGCAGDDSTETEPGDDPGMGNGTDTTEDDNPGAGGNDTPDGTTSEGTATVQVGADTGIGEVLVGPDEMTLYMFEEDTQGDGQSACMDGCMDNWPPLTVEEGEPTPGENVTAELSTFEREDGSMQVTANGWPLYYFAEDEQPGDANGQGVNDVWWVLGPDGSPIVSSGEGTQTGTPTGNETA